MGWAFDQNRKVWKLKEGNVFGRYGQGKNQTNQNKLAFAGDYYQSAYKALKSLGYNHETSVRMARFMTTHAAFESGYGGSDLAINDNNYGGFLTGQTKFKNMDEFTLRKAIVLRDIYPDTFKANNTQEYVHALYNGVDGKKYCDPKDKTEREYLKEINGTWDRSQYGINWWLQDNSLTPNNDFKKVNKYH